MRRIWLVVAGLLLFMGGRVSATDFVAQDATWWNSLPSDARPYVIAGMLDAYESGWSNGIVHESGRISDGIVALVNSIPQPSSPQSARDASLLTAYSKKIDDTIVYLKNGDQYVALASSPQFSKTFGAYASLVDSYYVNHPDHQDEHLGNLIGCFADSPPSGCSDYLK